jgi:ferredoxin
MGRQGIFSRKDIFQETGFMDNSISIDQQTCKVCGLCSEVCPNKILLKNPLGAFTFRQDRLSFCMKCGQCMAICPTKSISIEGLSYSRDFFEIPEGAPVEVPFFNMIISRRAIRNFKDQPVPKELLDKVVQAITFAPPGFTPIKTEIVVIQDTEIIRKALPYMIKVYDDLVRAMGNPIARLFVRRKVGKEKFHTIKNHVVPLMKNRLPELKRGEEDTLTRHAPAMILFHASKAADNYEADAYVALTYGFLAAHALGLGGSAMDIIPPAIQHSPELREMFSIPDGNQVVASMIVGYPKHHYQRGIRRALKRVTWI